MFKKSRIVKQSLSVFLLCAITVLSPVVAFADAVESIRVWRAPDHTRVVFDLTHAAQHKIFQLQNPSRLVVDIPNLDHEASLSNIDLNKTPIARIRSGKLTPTGTRYVLDLKEPIKPRSFPLKAHAGKPNRLVVDLYDNESTTAKTIQQVADDARSSVRRDIIIVIDAGHGGEDPGAIGPKRIQEKTVVMDIANRLARKVNARNGYKALLTRTDDYYLSLRKRRDFARKSRADLFISIHADAFKTPNARGASVFTLSNRGATSETARFLARKENDSDLIGGAGDVSLEDKDDVLAGVLVDLSMSATRSSSVDVGGHVLKQMGGIAHLHKKRVEEAGFLVLKSPDVPSILVETGFISNPGEAKRLATKAYREKMASSIFTGIRQYFEGNPPAGTYVAAKYNPSKNESPVITVPAIKTQLPASTQTVASTAQQRYGTYRVVRGDTLSEIADNFKMSLAEIKRVNRLKSTTVKIGQRLKVKDNATIVASLAPARDRVHRVVSGETLSGIALRYSTSITAIRKSNRLNSSSIRVGQNLLIPAG